MYQPNILNMEEYDINSPCVTVELARYLTSIRSVYNEQFVELPCLSALKYMPPLRDTSDEFC